MRWKVLQRWMRTVAMAAGLAAGMAVLSGVQAAELKIGFKSELTAADPHVLNGSNRNIWAHVYESLVAQDAQLRPKPGLALSWRLVNATTWEFRLRPNVKFHNGAVMTADDVKFSIDRALHLNGPRTYRTYLKDVDSVAVTGPLTIQVKGKRVSPTLPENIGLIAILPKSLGDNLTEESFGSGKAAIGTGPYKFSNWSHGQKVVLVKNADYWGEKEPWDSVTFQFIPREPARAAALLSGAVDIINEVTTNMADSLRGFDIASVTSYMLNYLAFDVFRDNSPSVKGPDGAPLNKNPLKNAKVRQALMTAINRDGIIKFLMKGDATASQQMVPKGFFGYDAGLALPAFDLAKAKALLTEAGYPQGFQLTLACPNNRYINDAKLCEAVAQVFSQIGVKTEVSTMPFAVFETRLDGGGTSEFSAYLLGNGAVTGDSLSGLISVLHSYDRGAMAGASNYGRYSNKDVDALIDKAAVTNDEKARSHLQQEALKAALEDAAIIPLLHLNTAWAMKKNIVIKPRANGFTMAMDIRAK